MSEKIDKDDLRENGHREGVKLIVGDYLKSFEMFDFSKLHYSRSNCTLNNLQRKRSNSRWKTKKNFKWVKIGFSDVGGLNLVTVFECWWQNLYHGKIEEIEATLVLTDRGYWSPNWPGHKPMPTPSCLWQAACPNGSHVPWNKLYLQFLCKIIFLDLVLLASVLLLA